MISYHSGAGLPARIRAGAAPALALALLAGSATLNAQPAASPARFDPAAFFTGRTTSEGTLTQIFASDKVTRVTTFGTRQASGDMVLDQQVQIGEQPVRNRTWRLRETTSGRFTGTISDAANDLTGTLAGNTLTLTYTMDNNLNVHQVITANPGGQSAQNVMRIRRFGITVARLTETIRRAD
ncbi:DUF3833 family protein [Alteraurantiacibacter palmitatis]|uniref:DUF3833 family protein n=1 Tax=Alteraurantiacibacter palmitatis TaxID=2054628 RepID=A0ABV7E2R4_9SPHN